MKLLIITHAIHKKQNKQWFAYGPYVKEMRLWEKYADELMIVAPRVTTPPDTIDLDYTHKNIVLKEVPAFSFTSFTAGIKSLFIIPYILYKLCSAMRKADHIHLRCPGNMGLLGGVVQLCFPGQKKSAKYAGNWDPNATQPVSYRFQKWILNNTFLTKNMQVMVYGDWPGSSRNIVPFFTATYPESKRAQFQKDFSPPFRAIYAGGLTPGKNPLYAVRLVQSLQQAGIEIRLDVYGEGVMKEPLKEYIEANGLQQTVALLGNRPAELLEAAYQTAHFLILPSTSEGWPKVVAEAMFFGCIPLATPVSCVPEMLGQGERGVLLTRHPETDVDAFCTLLSNQDRLKKMSIEAQPWSQQYTLEAFEEKIKSLI